MITKRCNVCAQYKQVNCTDEQYDNWRQGELIQNAMPNVPVDERELLISGICGKCFDAMFAEKET